MIISPWWKYGFLADKDTSMARARSHCPVSRHCHDRHWDRGHDAAPGPLAAHVRTAVQIDADSATAHIVSSDGAVAYSRTCLISTVCVDTEGAEQVTLFRFRNFLARETLRVF